MTGPALQPEARQTSVGSGGLARYLRLHALPALFGLLLYALIKQHSWSTAQTLAEAVGTVFAAAAMLQLAALMRGNALVVPAALRKPLVIFLALVALSTLLSGRPLFSLPRLQLYLACMLLAAGIYLTYRDQKTLPVAAFFLAIAVVHVPFVIEVVFWLVEHQDDYSSVVSVPNFSNVRHFGAAGFLAAMAATALPALSRRLDASAFALSCLALFGIIAMGSRGALLAWLLFIGLVGVLLPGSRRRILVMAAAALAVATGVVWYLHVSGVVQSPNLLVRLAAGGDVEGGLSNGRLEIWRDSISVILADPLFGRGPEAFRLAGIYASFHQPHNFVLQLLMQFGLVGCACLAWLLTVAVRNHGGPRSLLRKCRTSPGNVILLSAVVAFLAHSLIDGLLYHLVPLVHLALLCGLLGASLNQPPTKGR